MIKDKKIYKMVRKCFVWQKIRFVNVSMGLSS